MPFGIDWQTPLKEVTSKGRDFVHGVEATGEAADRYIKDQLYRASVDAGDIPGVAEDIAAEQLGRVSMASRFGELGAVIYGVYTIKDAVHTATRLLPRWLSYPANAAVDYFFLPVDNAFNYILSTQSQTIGKLLPGWQGFLDYVLPKTTVVKELKTQAQPGSPTYAQVQSDIAGLKRTEQYQQWEIDQLKAKTSGAPAGVTVIRQTTVAVPPSLEAQIMDVQGQVKVLTQSLNAIQARQEAQQDTLQSLSNEVRNVLQRLNAVQNTVASWPEVQNQLQQTMVAVEISLDQLSGQTLHNTNDLTSLAPLLLLLEPGIKGLNVLRQLEDTPCMCPHLPGLPNELGALLAAYEFATHG